MSLPNYLANIKSSGVYRYVFDKSQLPPQSADTLRLVVGYSEKGPFNTPLFVESKKDFISNFGNINKRLERKGIFFHRLALQALNAGPILALNIKPFPTDVTEATTPQVAVAKLSPWDVVAGKDVYTTDVAVPSIYDTNRFWKLDADLLPEKLKDNLGEKLINIATTDTLDNSCSFFFRPCLPEAYDITLRDWYAMQADMEAPSYLEDYLDVKLNRFFGEVYVFKGQFTPTLCNPKTGGVSGLDKGTLGDYFHVIKNNELAGDDDPSAYDVELNAYYTNMFGKRIDTLKALADDPNSNFIGSYQGCLLPEFKDGNGNYISLDILFNSDYVYHKMLMKIDENQLEAELAKEFYNWVDDETRYNATWEEDIIEAGANENDKDLQQFPLYYAYHPTYMSGYDYNLDSICGTTPAGIQEKIFNVLKTEGMQEALTNRVDCEYHYIVDTFDSFIENGCKGVLTALARKKDNSFAILNFPAMKKFIDTGDYTNAQTKRFDMTLIPKKNNFSLPKDADGASWAAYYTQLVISDGTVKTTIPSAALVSNLYMEKWTSRKPYYIVAGPNYGRIQENGLVGPDYNYSRADLDVLEPYGVNAIIYVPRKGVYINSNQTAKQVPVTALSKAHVRELVIYLQNEIESMLQNYQWELNTATLRDTIKTKADTILENVAANGGVYAYINTCDDSNNTPEVIDNEMVILDTSIEPARGAGKMVQRLTIHRTGGISSLK